MAGKSAFSYNAIVSVSNELSIDLKAPESS